MADRTDPLEPVKPASGGDGQSPDGATGDHGGPRPRKPTGDAAQELGRDGESSDGKGGRTDSPAPASRSESDFSLGPVAEDPDETIPLGDPPRPSSSVVGASERSTVDAFDRHATDDTTLATPGRSGRVVGGLGDPARIGNYLLLEEIARGGMGVVYKARQEPVDRLVALKMILAGPHASPDEIQRFHTEAQASARLNHPHIVPIYEVGEVDGCPFFSMEFISGTSLSQLIQDGPLDPRQAAAYLVPIAEAIAFAHQAGILHRDLKPSNVLISDSGQVKVTDFGLAKQVESDSELTASGAILGTPAYMPPEQAMGDHSAVSQTSDVYSLGATLYALLVGRPPFQAASPGQTIMQVIQKPVVPPRQLNGSIDRDLETICLKCLHKEPQLRYRSASALAEDLQRYLQGETILARRASLAEKSWRWCRRNPVTTALVTAVLLGILAVFAAAMFRVRSQRIEQLADLERRFEAQLDEPQLADEYLQKLRLLGDEIGRFDPEAAERLQRRFLERYRQFIVAQIERPRLSERDSTAIRSGLLRADAWYSGSDSPLQVSELLEKLEAVTLRWEIESELQPPYHNVAEWFDQGTIEVDNHRLALPSGGNPATRLLTTVDTAGDVLVEGEHREGWTRYQALGITLDSGTDSDGRSSGYEIVIHSPLQTRSQKLESLPSMEAQLKLGSRLQVSLRRESKTLGQIWVQVDRSKPLRWTVRREERNWSVRVNDQSPLEVEELFPTLLVDAPRQLGLIQLGPTEAHPPELALHSVRVLRRSAPAIPHPLVEADELFAQGDVSRALQAYRAIPDSMPPEIQREAKYKSALCLIQLNRGGEAESILSELIDAPAWQLRAWGQLWLIYLQAGRLDEARLVESRLVADEHFDSLVVQLPSATVEKLVEHYASYAPNRSDNVLISEDRLQELERAARIVRLLGAPPDEIADIHETLAYFYFLAGRPNETLRTTGRILENYPGATEALWSVLNTHVTALFALGREDEVKPLLQPVIFQAEGEVHPGREPFLLLLAKVEMALDQPADAIRTLELLLERIESLNYLSDRYLLQFLLGLAHEMEGRDAIAQQIWTHLLQSIRNYPDLDYDCAECYVLTAGVTGDVSEEDVERLMAFYTSDQLGGPLLDSLRREVVSNAEVATFIKHLWNRPGGRRVLRAQLLPSDDLSDTDVKTFVALEVARLIIGGFENADEFELTAEQQKALLDSVPDAIDLVKKNTLTQTELTQAAMASRGITGALGWDGLAQRLPSSLVPAAGYLLGCHLLHQEKPEAAKHVLNSARQSAPADSDWRDLLTEKLRSLPTSEAE